MYVCLYVLMWYNISVYVWTRLMKVTPRASSLYDYLCVFACVWVCMCVLGEVV